MNRRDLLFLWIFIAVWAVFFINVQPTMTSKQLIIAFTIHFAILDILVIALFILSAVIPKFGKWGDKKIFGSKEEEKAPEENKPIGDDDKKLLLSDLSSRLPYGVKCKVKYSVINETTFGEIVEMEQDDEVVAVNIVDESVKTSNLGEWSDIKQIRPYLRPLESMTEEEADEFDKIADDLLTDGENVKIWATVIEWLVKHNFDYRGLIPKGLALKL